MKDYVKNETILPKGKKLRKKKNKKNLGELCCKGKREKLGERCTNLIWNEIKSQHSPT